MRIPFVRPRDPRPVLVVMHQERSCPGQIGVALRGRGRVLDVRRPRFGDPLPASLDAHAGAIVLGGPMSANDGDAWLRREIDWLAVPLREGRPLLGVCLGAQMLASHLGARVAPHHMGRVQVGHYRLEMTDAGRSLLGVPPLSRVLQWHRENFLVPAGGTLLAYDDHAAQAFAYGPSALALQFHPEATTDVLRRWLSEDDGLPSMPGAASRSSILPMHEDYAAGAARWVDALVAGWLRRDSHKGPRAVAERLGAAPAAVRA